MSIPDAKSPASSCWGNPEAAPQPELIDALRRPVPGPDWGLWKTTILSVASFGLLPLLIWPSQFREFTSMESLQLAALADWAQSGGAPTRVGNRLARAARAVEASAFLGLIPILLGLYVATAFVIQFSHQRFDLNALLDMTYRAADSAAPPAPRTVLHLGHPGHGVPLNLLWSTVLSIGYGLHWLQVRIHVNAMKRFSRMFHRTLRDRPYFSERSIWRTAGIWPIGLIAVAGFAHCGAWWGLPMLIAAGSQRRYMWQTSRAMRASLAGRVGGMISPSSPAISTNYPAMATCPMRGCGALLPLVAQFCPRCGVRIGRGNVV